MKAQAIAVTLAGLIGLAFGLLISAPDLVSKGYVTPLDTFNPYNPRILGFWVGKLSLFPLIFIVIAIAVTARKAGWLLSMFSCLGAIAGVWLVICAGVIAVAAAAQPKSEFPLAAASADRDDFVSNATASCIRGRQNASESKNLSPATISALCGCYANSLADMTTREEFQYFAQTKSPPPSMIEKIKAVFQKCGRQVNAIGN